MNILITGATDGIGLALARAYQQQDVRLILVGRRPHSELDSALFTPQCYCQSDLSTSQSATALSSWLHEQHVSELDLVIHNAGLGYIGAVTTQSAPSINALLQVNLWTPIALTHLLYPLVKRRRGKFVFISSVATGLATPDYAVYTATKAALEGFVRSWQIELTAEGNPVRAQVIRPGATRTHMHRKSGGDPTQLGWQRFPTPERVARQIMDALATERRVVTLGFGNRLLHLAGTQLAGPVDRFLSSREKRRYPTARQAAPPATEADQTPPNTHRRHCVITGAADGIGRALAQQLAQAGYNITGIDVDAERAAQTQAEFQAAGYAIDFIHADLAQVDTLPKLVTALHTRPPIDLLIHNAGISAVGPFVRSNLARQQAVVAINLAAPLLLTAGLFAQAQLKAGSTVIFISSLSHFASYPGAAVYAATKDGIAAYARSLGVALAPQGIHTLTVYPGPTRTAHARRYSPDNRREEKRMAPEQLAATIHQASQQHRRHLVPGLANQLVAWVGRLWPQPIEAFMRRTLYAGLRSKQP